MAAEDTALERHEHDLGLQHDLPRLVPRRNLVKFGSALAAMALGAPLWRNRAVAAAADVCAQVPEETAGPYPGDGSNGPNALAASGIVRRDIRASFGSSTTVAQGVPTTITMTVLDGTDECRPLVGAAVYLWHCDREGRYSMYSAGVTGENYLRGVQETDANGQVSFLTVFPGCYAGRWPHVHFELYPSLAAATAAGNKVATSQLALPQAISEQVYATAGYSASVGNLAGVSLATDNVFRDGWSLQTPEVGGDVNSGIVLTSTITVLGTGSASSPPTFTTVTPSTAPSFVGAPAALVTLATPARLLDTRSDSRLGYGGAKPAAGATVTLAVAGRGGLPAEDVAAVVLNVTATEATAAGYVTVWPQGERPLSSNLNLERAGQTRANLVTVPVGSDGAVRLYTASGTHLVADVFAWYRPAASAQAGRFQPLTPTRILDTRSDAQIGYLGAKPAGGAVTVVGVAGRGGVPASGVSAVVLNLTSVQGAAAGYVSVWPEGPWPGTSNLNTERADQIVANQVIVPLGADGAIRLLSTAAAHLLLDVTGWFTDASATAATTGLFVPVSPYRVLDTRSGARPGAGSVVTLLAAAAGTAAVGRSALVMNVTATEPAAAGFVTVWPEGERTWTSSLNVEAAGQTIPNQVTTAVGADGGVRIYSSAPSHLVADITGWYA